MILVVEQRCCSIQLVQEIQVHWIFYVAVIVDTFDSVSFCYGCSTQEEIVSGFASSPCKFRVNPRTVSIIYNWDGQTVLSMHRLFTQKNKFNYSHLCSEIKVFGKNPTFRQAWSIWYSTTKHAVHSYLRNWTTTQTEYLMGSTVNNLLKLWVCKLSFLKRHPWIQKAKNMKQRALIAV
jgi:hypothetical protein